MQKSSTERAIDEKKRGNNTKRMEQDTKRAGGSFERKDVLATDPPCSIATTSHPPTTYTLSMHINMYYAPSNTLPTAFHNPAMHTTNKHKA